MCAFSIRFTRACGDRECALVSRACRGRELATFVVLHRFSGEEKSGLVCKIHSRPDPHLCTVLGAVFVLGKKATKTLWFNSYIVFKPRFCFLRFKSGCRMIYTDFVSVNTM